MDRTMYLPMKKESVSNIGTAPVSARPYYDQSYFPLERDAIFRRVWLHIGRECEVAEPGQFFVRPVEIADTSILVVRGADGKLRAFHNVCTHRGTELVASAAGRARSFTCRYHAWTFGTDGALRGIPDEDAFFGIDKARCGLPEVALDTCAGFIFISLDKSPRQSLREFLGTWADTLEGLGLGSSDQYSEYVYEVEADWKTTHNNFQEIYHGRVVHSKSIGSKSQGGPNPFGYPTEYRFSDDPLHSSMKLWGNPEYTPTPTERVVGSIFRRFDKEGGSAAARPLSDFLSIFPNLTIFVTNRQWFSQTIWPLGPNRTRSVIRLHWTGKDANASQRFVREHALASTLDVHSEDRDIIEAAHRGIRSGAIDVVNFQMHEVMLRQHINAVVHHVEAYRRETEGAL